MKFSIYIFSLSFTLCSLLTDTLGFSKEYQLPGDHSHGSVLSDSTQQTTNLNSIQQQLDGLTQSLNSYVQGYQELRVKYDGVRKELNNLTSSLQQKIIDYDKVVNRYLVLEQEYNFTKSRVSDLTNRILTLEQDRNSSSNGDRLSSTALEKISKRITEVEQIQALQQSPIAFLARLSTNFSPKEDKKIVFDVHDINEGSAYSSTTGVFTAPIEGLYLFTVTLTTRSKDPDAYLFRNGYTVLPLFNHSEDDYRQASASVVIHLLRGDRVWVDWNGGTETSVIQAKHETVFSGCLLQSYTTSTTG